MNIKFTFEKAPCSYYMQSFCHILSSLKVFVISIIIDTSVIELRKLIFRLEDLREFDSVWLSWVKYSTNRDEQKWFTH